MSRRSYLILADKSAWRIGLGADAVVIVNVDFGLESDPTNADLARAIADALHSQGYRGEPVALALPSSWCIAAGISTSDLPGRNRHRAMLYLLEEKLPLASEEIVADFIHVAPEHALGIAVETARIRPIVTALERCGVVIEVICPKMVLACLNAVDTSVEWSGTIVCESTFADFITSQKGAMHSWRWVRTDGRTLERLLADSPPLESLTLIGDSGSLADKLTQWSGITVRSDHEGTADELAACSWNRISSGNIEPPVNLRRDELGPTDRYRQIRTPMLAALAAAIILLLCVAGVILSRAWAYESIARHHREKTHALFVELFDEPAPTSPRRRMESRLRELEGLRAMPTTADNAQEQLITSSALITLHDLLQRLPTDLRMCLLDIRIEPRGVTILGQARSHGDADRIAGSLRHGERFEVQPPRTENLKDGGVSFALQITPVSEVIPTDDASRTAQADSPSIGSTQ